MTDMNSVNLIGRLTRDIGENDFRYTQGGTACMKLSLAVNRSRKGAEGQWADEVSYIDVTVWGKQAENIRQFLGKGKQVAVAGFLKQDRWEKDGQKQSKICVVADNVFLLGGREGGQAQQGGQFKPVQQKQSDFWPQDNGGFQEDIPF